MQKLKIIWICHFTDSKIQSKLSLWRAINEYASWIPNMIKGFNDIDEIELHIISPHEYLKQQISFTENNIHYHFIPYGIPIFHRHWPGSFRFDVLTNFATFRHKVKYLVYKINPDLINLIGAENAYYSSAIIDFKDKYPILITIQGFIGQMKDAIASTTYLRKRTEIEEKILREFNHFAGEQDSSNYISKYNNKHQFYKLYFPVNELFIKTTQDTEKKYDCIFYGRLSKQKGVHDFIYLINELKKKNPEIKACIVGPGDSEPFIKLANELDCFPNIKFVGFVKTQKELFEIVKSAQVFLLPSHFERLSSTIRETMFLKVPIVAYATGGIPYVNEFDENILLVETGNYKAMAEKVEWLLNNTIERSALADKAYNYAQNEYSLKINTERLISAYIEIISKFKE